MGQRRPRTRDGSAEWLTCDGRVSRGGSRHHRQYPLLAQLRLGVSDFWSSLVFLFELSLSRSVSL